MPPRIDPMTGEPYRDSERDRAASTTVATATHQIPSAASGGFVPGTPEHTAYLQEQVTNLAPNIIGNIPMWDAMVGTPGQSGLARSRDNQLDALGQGYEGARGDFLAGMGDARGYLGQGYGGASGYLGRAYGDVTGAYGQGQGAISDYYGQAQGQLGQARGDLTGMYEQGMAGLDPWIQQDMAMRQEYQNRLMGGDTDFWDRRQQQAAAGLGASLERQGVTGSARGAALSNASTELQMQEQQAFYDRARNAPGSEFAQQRAGMAGQLGAGLAGLGQYGAGLYGQQGSASAGLYGDQAGAMQNLGMAGMGLESQYGQGTAGLSSAQAAALAGMQSQYGQQQANTWGRWGESAAANLASHAGLEYERQKYEDSQNFDWGTFGAGLLTGGVKAGVSAAVGG